MLCWLVQACSNSILLLQVWQRLQRIESLAEQISAAQGGKSPGPAPEADLPLNALNHVLNKAARAGVLWRLLLLVTNCTRPCTSACVR